MPRLPRITAGELLRALRGDGWEVSRQSGSHHILRHPTKKGAVVVPYHGGRDLRTGTLASIIDQAGLTADDLRRLL